jgi:rare lipoprotein A (peptidoglycan hydrolase)
VVSYFYGNPEKKKDEAAAQDAGLQPRNAGAAATTRDANGFPGRAEASLPAPSNREVTPIGKTAAGKSLSKITETGICSWISDGDMNQSRFYALHRSAPAGTIVKVTNKMNDQHVFVKVVGLLPDTGDNDNTIIKISETAVRKLGALDAQFLVELNYGLVN